MNWKAVLAFSVAVQTIAATTYAGEAATLSTAREVAKLGLLAYDAGRFDEAVEMLSKAYAAVHVPTLALATARALAKTGKLVAASELYLEAVRIPRDQSWQESQFEAQRDAENERLALLGRIPRLSIAVAGVTWSQVTVRIDGVAVPQSLMDTEQMVDPGKRNVEGNYGNQVSKQSVLVKEGEHARVSLGFTPSDAAAPTESNGPPKSKLSAPAMAKVQPSAGAAAPGSVQRTVGWVTVSAGGVGLAVGAVSGLLAMSKRSSSLDSKVCPGPGQVSCISQSASDVDAYNSMRMVSMVGFIAGGVLTATGVTLLLSAPKNETSPSAGIWIGPRSAGIYGGF